MRAGASLLAIGGAHIDRRGIVADTYVPAVSNPGTMREEIGGGAFNALRMAARRGAAGAIMSLRGGDGAGAMVAGAIAAAGLADLSAIFLDRATPSYTALLRNDGELVAGLADMGLYEIAFDKQMRRRKTREAIEAADAVLCDGNLPAAALARLAIEAGRRRRPVFAIAVSPAKVVRFVSVCRELECLFMNRREAAALGAATELDPPQLVAALRGIGLTAAVVTQGAAPVIAFDRATAFTIAPPKVDRIVDVTGAGDALAGAVTAARLSGLTFAEAVREGVAAAALAIQCAEASPAADATSFAAALALVGEPRPVA